MTSATLPQRGGAISPRTSAQPDSPPIPAANLKLALEATRSQWQPRVDALLDSACFILGEEVRLFEREFATFLNARHCVGVASGTSAIELSLRDARVHGEVITSALTAPFTAVGIIAAGATPRFADIDPATLQIDPDDAGNRISRRTAALLPVHLYGDLCPLDRCVRVARDRRLTLVQDACQAHGADFLGEPLTRFSRYVGYSFYPTKNLGCLGDGGAIATNSGAVQARLRRVRDGGRNQYQVSVGPGVNSRLDELQACFLRVFLTHLQSWNAARARLAALYDQALVSCPGITLVRRSPGSVHHLYVVRVRRRARLREALAAQGIGTGVHYPVPLHLHPAFGVARQRRDLPHAEKACREVLSLPLWHGLPDSGVLRVADAIRRFYSS